MKSIKIFFVLLIIVTVVSGCSTGNNTKENIVERINKKYIDFPSYTASGTLTIVGNKSSNIYNFSQMYKSSNKFRMEFDDVVFISSENGVFVCNEKADSNIDGNNLKNEMYLYFVNSFFKQYFTSENANTPEFLKRNMVCLECDMQHKFLSKSRLYLDSKTLIPQLLEFYDNIGICVYKIEIKQFKTEKNINDELFNI